MMNEELIELVNEAAVYLKQSNNSLKYLQGLIREIEYASQYILINEYNQSKRIKRLEEIVDIFKKTLPEFLITIPILDRLSSEWLDKYDKWKADI